MTPYDELALIAERCARSAGALLLEHAGRPAEAVASKSSATDMVSEADRASEAHLVDLLGSLRPDDAIFGEEGAAREGTTGLRWVLDPLDGTTNFLYRVPVWAVSVACEDADGPVAGCVYAPIGDACFRATRGGGATLDGVAINVSGTTELPQALIGTGFSYHAAVRVAQASLLGGVIAEVRDMRRAGSAALDLASVACGRLDGFYETGIRHWDWAAGRLLVEEAGGVFALLPGIAGERQVVAANAHLFGQLAALVR